MSKLSATAAPVVLAMALLLDGACDSRRPDPAIAPADAARLVVGRWKARLGDFVSTMEMDLREDHSASMVITTPDADRADAVLPHEGKGHWNLDRGTLGVTVDEPAGGAPIPPAQRELRFMIEEMGKALLDCDNEKIRFVREDAALSRPAVQ